MNWDAQRRRIYEHFGLAKPTETLADSVGDKFAETSRGAFGRSSRRSRALGASVSANGGVSFGPSTATASILGNTSMRNTLRMNGHGDAEKSPALAMQSGIEQRFERDKAEKYALKVKELNGVRSQEGAYPIIHRFQSVEKEAGIDVSANGLMRLRFLIGYRAPRLW